MYIGMNRFTLTSWLHPPNVCAQLKHRVEGEAIVAECRSQCCTVQECIHVLLIARGNGSIKQMGQHSGDMKHVTVVVKQAISNPCEAWKNQ